MNKPVMYNEPLFMVSSKACCVLPSAASKLLKFSTNRPKTATIRGMVTPAAMLDSAAATRKMTSCRLA